MVKMGENLHTHRPNDPARVQRSTHVKPGNSAHPQRGFMGKTTIQLIFQTRF